VESCEGSFAGELLELLPCEGEEEGEGEGVVRAPTWTPREAFPPAVYGCPMMPYTQTWTRAYPHTLRLCAALFDCRRVAQPLKRET